MKRLGRKLRETVVVLAIVAAVIFALWIVSYIPAKEILVWLKTNWWSTLVGFMLSTIGGMIVAFFLGEEDNKK